MSYSFIFEKKIFEKIKNLQLNFGDCKYIIYDWYTATWITEISCFNQAYNILENLLPVLIIFYD